jgi:hypothetical protein
MARRGRSLLLGAAAALAFVVGGPVLARVRDPLAAAPRRKATVLLFVARDCPISNAYAREMERIRAAYAPRDVAFFLVYPDPDLTPDDARKHAREFGHAAPVSVDAAQRLVRRAGATVTPEAAVFSPAGRLLYRGRIDDRYVSLGRRREHVTSRDLRAALDAILENRPVARPRTRPVGCFIPDVRR